MTTGSKRKTFWYPCYQLIALNLRHYDKMNVLYIFYATYYITAENEKEHSIWQA